MTPGRHPERNLATALSGLVLFEGGELIPIQVSNSSERTEAGERPRPPVAPRGQRDAREHVGRNLRLAFPLPDSGSFASLLNGIEEA